MAFMGQTIMMTGRRKPLRNTIRTTDVYIKVKTPIEAYVKRASKLLDTNDEIHIYGLGRSICKAVELACYFKHLRVEISTKTMDLIDDMEDEIKVRQSSVVEIKIKK